MQEGKHNAIGRRAGSRNTRATILAAAQQLFADKGYDRATMQAIGVKAGVDPAMVVYYFKNKQQLFVEAVMPTYNPVERIAQVLRGDPATVGERYATLMVEFLEDPYLGRMAQGLIRAAVAEPAATMLRRSVEEELVRAVVANTAWPDAELRANFVCSIYIGFVMARYITKIEPLATVPPQEVIRYLAPLLQQCLGESL